MEIAAGSEKYSSTARSAGRQRPEARKHARRERIWFRTKHPVREIATCTVARAASSSNVGGGLGSFLGRKAHMGEIVGEGCDVWGHGGGMPDEWLVRCPTRAFMIFGVGAGAVPFSLRCGPSGIDKPRLPVWEQPRTSRVITIHATTTPKLLMADLITFTDAPSRARPTPSTLS